MFPEEEETAMEEAIEPGTGAVIGFDFTKSDIPMADGRIVLYEGLESVKLWIEKQINTEKDKYAVYENEDYGVTSLRELVMSEFPELFVKTQIEDEITERLLEHPNITDVSEFEFEKEKRTWNVSFTVSTVYGEIEEVTTI